MRLTRLMQVERVKRGKNNSSKSPWSHSSWSNCRISLFAIAWGPHNVSRVLSIYINQLVNLNRVRCVTVTPPPCVPISAISRAINSISYFPSIPMFLKINAADKINASGKVVEREITVLSFREVTVHGLILEFRYSLSSEEHIGC
jgi:hypothetical protein